MDVEITMEITDTVHIDGVNVLEIKISLCVEMLSVLFISLIVYGELEK